MNVSGVPAATPGPIVQRLPATIRSLRLAAPPPGHEKKLTDVWCIDCQKFFSRGESPVGCGHWYPWYEWRRARRKDFKPPPKLRKPTKPGKPTKPRAELGKPTKPRAELGKPTKPRAELGKPTKPRAELGKPTKPRAELGKPTKPRAELGKPTKPRAELGKPTKRAGSYKSARRQLIRKWGPFCLRCQTFHLTRDLTVDHILPLAKGGDNHMSNYQLLCLPCNNDKAEREDDYRTPHPRSRYPFVVYEGH